MAVSIITNAIFNMLYKRIILLLIGILSFTLKAQSTFRYKIITVAFYNLENLFDTENDPITFDDDRTPDGKDNWTQNIYQDKLQNMANVISEIGKDVTGKAPALLGVAEIENRKVLEGLVNDKSLPLIRLWNYSF